MLLLEKCATAYLLTLCANEKVDKIPLLVREIAFSKLRKTQKQVAEQLEAFAETNGETNE